MDHALDRIARATRIALLVRTDPTVRMQPCERDGDLHNAIRFATHQGTTREIVIQRALSLVVAHEQYDGCGVLARAIAEWRLEPPP